MLLSDLVVTHTVVNGETSGYDGISGDFSDAVMVTDAEWQGRAKGLLKAELKRKNMTYKQLAERLQAMGVAETPENIANKISRGGFSAVFLLQCFEAIGCKQITLNSD